MLIQQTANYRVLGLFSDHSASKLGLLKGVKQTQTGTSMSVKPLLGCSCSASTRAVAQIKACKSAKSSHRDIAVLHVVSLSIEWEEWWGESVTWSHKLQVPRRANKLRKFISKLSSTCFLMSAPQNSSPLCGFMLNKSQFSTIKILWIPAWGIPMKHHIFSHQPLWHTGISFTNTGLWVQQHFPLPLAKDRTQPVVQSVQGDPKSRSPIWFCFLSKNLPLQIDSSPAQSAGECARSSCSSWRFQILTFSDDVFFSPRPLAESFALSSAQIACHRYSVFDLKYLLSLQWLYAETQ